MPQPAPRGHGLPLCHLPTCRSRKECPVLPRAEGSPGLHFWDNSAPLGLAPCQLPPALPVSPAEQGGPASPSRTPHPAPRTRLHRKERRAAPVSPLPHPLPHPSQHSSPATGSADVLGGALHGRELHCPLPDGGQPHGYFWRGWSGGVGWRGAGRKGGAVGLVLSSKRNLKNVAIPGRLGGAGGLGLGVRSTP